MLYYILLIIYLAITPTKAPLETTQSKPTYSVKYTVIADDNDDFDDVKSA